MISEELSSAVRLLLVDHATRGSSGRIAVRAEEACERLSRHLARLMGETGSRAVFNRSLLLTRAKFPWLASVVGAVGLPPGETPWTPLRASMELQDPEVAVAAFGELLETFVRLLGRLIGEPFALRLVREAWPEVFQRVDAGAP